MILEINTTDQTATYSVGANPILSLASGQITFALSAMLEIPDTQFFSAIDLASLWGDFIILSDIERDGSISEFDRSIKHEGNILEMKSQVGMDTIEFCRKNLLRIIAEMDRIRDQYK